jgi:hypothetical protein
VPWSSSAQAEHAKEGRDKEFYQRQQINTAVDDGEVSPTKDDDDTAGVVEHWEWGPMFEIILIGLNSAIGAH